MRTTRRAMIAIGLAFLVLGSRGSGMQIAIPVLSGALVAFAVFGLPTEE